LRRIDVLEPKVHALRQRLAPPRQSKIDYAHFGSIVFMRMAAALATDEPSTL
jgi:hypothetical protein